MKAIAAAVLLLASCDLPCPKINQWVTIASPDETLLPLFEACRASQQQPSIITCVPMSMSMSNTGQPPCACLPLCLRVLQIIDQFQGAEQLEMCSVHPLPDGGVGAGTVEVTYRPSTCP